MRTGHSIRQLPALIVTMFLLAALIAVVQGRAVTQEPVRPQERPTALPQRGAPVVFDGNTLFYVQDYVGALSPEEIAEAAERRLVRIAEDPFYSPSLFTIKTADKKAEIYYRANLVGVVNQEQAARTGLAPVEMAARLVQISEAAISQYRERRLPAARVRAGFSMAAATLLLVGLLVVIWRVHRRLTARVEAAARQAGLARQKREGLVVPPDKAALIQTYALGLLRAGITLVLGVAYLMAAFSFFPLTKGYALSVLEYLLDPVRTLWQGLLAHAGDLVFILVLTLLARYLLKALRWLLSQAAAGSVTLPGVEPDWAMLLYKIVRIAVVAVTAVMIYPYIPGSSTEAFKGISLFAGALFTIGASGVAGNFIGGLALVFAGTLHRGDWVRIGEVTGDVVDTTLLLTRIRTFTNEIVTIPNASVLGTHVVNYSTRARAGGLILHTEVTIGYNAPWRTVHDLLIEAARRTRDILEEPAPFVLQRSLNDFHITYRIYAYTRNPNAMVLIYGELHQNIQDAFNEGGIEILSPGYSYLRDGNASTIPESYRPEGYRPEPFTVRVERDGGERHGT